MQEVKTQEKIYLMAVSAASYIVLDLPVRLISNLPPYAGIKSFLPFMLGIFFGCYGVIGACSGAIIISLALSDKFSIFSTKDSSNLLKAFL